jgi:hypothetical protein
LHCSSFPFHSYHAKRRYVKEIKLLNSLTMLYFHILSPPEFCNAKEVIEYTNQKDQLQQAIRRISAAFIGNSRCTGEMLPKTPSKLQP